MTISASAETKSTSAESHGKTTASQAELTKSVSTGWTLLREGKVESIEIGDSWETVGHETFDGVAIYRKRLAIPLRNKARSSRWILQIDAAATKTTVRVNGQQVAQHLGGWTPFRIDLTPFVSRDSRRQTGEAELQLEIEVDERVGHNTQGFLPIVVPHFGGIWKDVQLIEMKGPAYLDDLTLLLAGFEGSDSIRLQSQIRGASGIDVKTLEVGYRIIGPSEVVKTDWQWERVQSAEKRLAGNPPIDASGTDRAIGFVNTTIVPPKIYRWSPQRPFQYEIEIVLRKRDSDVILHRLVRRASIRHFEADGRKLRLNGRPVNIRGLLNWGYAPPRLAPSIDEASMRKEIEFAKQRGFNLMKFCLWTPPKRYLELADEMGMLTWIEYPTWHPNFSPQHTDDLTTEFTELFYYDRNTASAILRSLTCETGHGASFDVIRRLYELGHEMIPGAIIEDDSSWIGWHRIHDFYDDHPYGNNETWLAKLDELDDHIRQRDPKPLVLGEAIAADTWEPVIQNGSEITPPHASLSASEQPRFVAELLSSHALKDAATLKRDSKHVALAIRKYQIEAFRLRLPDAGYVVSVIRDFPKASMGLIDRWGDAKWTEDQFAWHGPIQLVLEDGQLQRSLTAGQNWNVRVSIVGRDDLPTSMDIKLQWFGENHFEQQEDPLSTAGSDSAAKAVFETTLGVPDTSAPEPSTLRVELLADGKLIAQNQWRLWLVPSQERSVAVQRSEPIYVSRTIDSDTRKRLGLGPSIIRGDVNEAITASTLGAHPVIVANGFEAGLLDAIYRGARCVMLPDGQPGSLILRNHWFLRGGPVVADHPLVRQIDRNFLVDLQTFDLAGPVLKNFALQEQGTPIVSLWDNHDLDRYLTHSLLWESRIGRGQLIVSALNHEASPAGQYLLQSLIARVREPIDAKAMSEQAIEALRRQIDQKQRSLADQNWFFRPATDPKEASAETAHPVWLTESTSSNQWTPIRITEHWDGQGFASLDGWGFYHRTVKIPDQWNTRELYLSFTGVDDYFDLFVDGVKIGSGGNRERRETAFELRKSFSLPAETTSDGELDIRVQVYDWQGAGGIFRPVYLSTQPLPEQSQSSGQAAWIVR